MIGRQDLSEQAGKQSAADVLQGARVLLIDDDPDLHHAIRQMLEPAGCTVTCCSSGPAGIDQLRQDLPDVLLLDVMLSTPTEGFNVAFRIRQEPRLQSVPIVMISAIGEYLGLDFAKQLGDGYVRADDYLEKPFDAETLRRVLSEVLAGKDRT